MMKWKSRSLLAAVGGDLGLRAAVRGRGPGGVASAGVGLVAVVGPGEGVSGEKEAEGAKEGVSGEGRVGRREARMRARRGDAGGGGVGGRMVLGGVSRQRACQRHIRSPKAIR